MRHLRQTMLPEIGEAGQARLESPPVYLSGAGHAVAWAAVYLKRAGVDVAAAPGDGIQSVAVPVLDPVRPELSAAAHAVAGAWAAVELIKQRVGAGTPASLDIRITGPDRDSA